LTFSSIRQSLFSRVICLCLTFSFGTTMVITPKAQAGVVGLPQPGTMVDLSPAYVPLMITGLSVHPENPLLMDFILSTGNSGLNADQVKKQSDRLIKYFLTCLTIPENNQWVNLSPYEKQRIIPDDLGQTVLGQDMLAQDYILKQLTASLIYPEKNLGKNFWDAVYAKARQMYGTTQVPVNTFNKVWILPEYAKFYEHNNTVFVIKSHLKVMLDEDYLALQKHSAALSSDIRNDTHSIGANIIRQIILPAIENEVNTGKNFAQLRQIYNSMILAVWYKNNLKQALLNQVYTDKSKVKGVKVDDPAIKEKIYQQYLQAYKKGVFNYIKEEVGPNSQETVSRKYFSGGIKMVSYAMISRATLTQVLGFLRGNPQVDYKAVVNLVGERDNINGSSNDNGEYPFWHPNFFKNIASLKNQPPNPLTAGSLAKRERIIRKIVKQFLSKRNIVKEFSLDIGDTREGIVVTVTEKQGPIPTFFWLFRGTNRDLVNEDFVRMFSGDVKLIKMPNTDPYSFTFKIVNAAMTAGEYIEKFQKANSLEEFRAVENKLKGQIRDGHEDAQMVDFVAQILDYAIGKAAEKMTADTDRNSKEWKENKSGWFRYLAANLNSQILDSRKKDSRIQITFKSTVLNDSDWVDWKNGLVSKMAMGTINEIKAGAGVDIRIIIADAPEGGDTTAIDKELDKLRAQYTKANIRIITEATNAGKKGPEALMAEILKWKPAIIIVRSGTTAFSKKGNPDGYKEFFKKAYANGVRVVLRSGVGVDNVDIQAASDNKITVARTHGSANSVADLTLYLASLIPHTNGFVPKATADISPNIQWSQISKTGPEEYEKLIASKAKDYPEHRNTIDPYLNGTHQDVEVGLAKALEGQVLGVVGLGAIPLALMEKLRAIKKSGINFDVIGYTRSFDGPQAADRRALAEKIGMTPAETRLDLFKQATIISMHVGEPNAQITEEELNSAKNLKVIINTSRLAVFPPAIAEKFLARGGILLGDLDLTPELIALMDKYPGKVIILPHIGASTKDGKEGVEINTVPSIREAVEALLWKVPSTDIMENMNGVPIEGIFANQAMAALPMDDLAKITRWANDSSNAWDDTVVKNVRDWYSSNAVSDAQRNELLRIIFEDKADKIKAGFSSKTGVLQPGTAGTRAEMENFAEDKIGPNYFSTTTVIQYTLSFVNWYKATKQIGPAFIAKEVRENSDAYGDVAAKILIANGIRVIRINKPVSTPFTSYLAKWLGRTEKVKPAFGYQISASHNKLADNGIKFMGPEGQQFMPDVMIPLAEGIPSLLDVVSVPDIVLTENHLYHVLSEQEFNQALNDYYDAIDSTVDPYINVLFRSLKGKRFVFTPLNGASGEETKGYLKRHGLDEGVDYLMPPQEVILPTELPADLFALKRINSSDPSNDDVLKPARVFADKRGIDLVFARDSDGDRLVLAVKINGEWKKLNGNQNAIVMLHDRLSHSHGADFSKMLFMRSHATTALLDKIAAAFAVKTIVVPVGFKYFGAKIIQVFNSIVGHNYFGAEESYGTSNGHINEKDGLSGLVNMLAIIARLQQEQKGRNIFDYLNSIYMEYGYPGDRTIDLPLPGITKPEKDIARDKVKAVLMNLEIGGEFAGYRITKCEKQVNVEGIGSFHDGYDLILQDSDGKSFRLLFRASGTEPIFKAYFSWQKPEPIEPKTPEKLKEVILQTKVFSDSVELKLNAAFQEMAGNKAMASNLIVVHFVNSDDLDDGNWGAGLMPNGDFVASEEDAKIAGIGLGSILKTMSGAVVGKVMEVNIELSQVKDAAQSTPLPGKLVKLTKGTVPQEDAKKIFRAIVKLWEARILNQKKKQALITLALFLNQHNFEESGWYDNSDLERAIADLQGTAFVRNRIVPDDVITVIRSSFVFQHPTNVPSIIDPLEDGGFNYRTSELLVDRASLAGSPEGGIDLASKHLRMESSGEKVNITFDPLMIAQFKRGDFSGVRIQILDVVPINPVSLLGLKEDEASELLAKV